MSTQNSEDTRLKAIHKILMHIASDDAAMGLYKEHSRPKIIDALKENGFTSERDIFDAGEMFGITIENEMFPLLVQIS